MRKILETGKEMIVGNCKIGDRGMLQMDSEQDKSSEGSPPGFCKGNGEWGERVFSDLQTCSLQ